jgi:hypothetical protein
MKTDKIITIAQGLKKIEEFMGTMGVIFSGPVEIRGLGDSALVTARLYFSLDDHSQCAEKSASQEEGSH